MAATQAERQISVISPLGDDVLLFRSMSGSEQLGRLFEYQVEVLSAEKDIDFGKILGQPMTVELKLQKGGTREFNGVVTQFTHGGSYGEYTRYLVVLRPWLWLLTRTSDCFIFQKEPVIDIVKKICKKGIYGGWMDLDDTLVSKTYPVLNYCVQYRETDFNFVCRILEHAGIYFYFRHKGRKHTMVLADSYGAHVPVANYATVNFANDDSRDAYGDEAVTAFSASGEIQASGYALKDFDFEKMMGGSHGQLNAKESIAAAFNQPAYQQYDFPGGFAKEDFGLVVAESRIEGLHGQSEKISASSNARGLAVGALFTLVRHPLASLNREYLITRLEVRLNADDYGSGGHQGGKLFECGFNAVGKKFPFRVERSIPKPLVYGPQTAVVVGKAGEEILTDPYGRVKVKFHWDRKPERDENSSCWVRVSQAWAGERWGGMFIPRIGMEVIVEFLDGDPDRPLITGCVYNSQTMPPYDLPQHQTRSTLKSNSSKGGGGFNEIRFEDKKDAEEIFVQAQLDFNRVVKHNDTLKVGFLAKKPGSQTIEIKADQTLTVGNDQTVHIVKDQKTDIDETQKVKIGKTCVIEAGTSIELKVGGSSILIEAAQITIKSAQIKLDASAKVEVKAGALVDVKGALVTIN